MAAHAGCAFPPIPSAMSGEILVELDGVSRRYGDTEAVREVSFAIRQGEVLGFLGPNGAGKTTTMQILTGNLAPTQGRVTIAGHDLLDDPRAAKRALGYLPETPPVYRDLTVDEYLDFCAALHGIVRGERRAASARAKERCGLHENGRRLIGNLSKGFQQRVGLAQAIIHLPPVIVLDEPTVGLDPIQIREIRQLIRELGREHGVILSTHILPEVQATCDRVQIIHRGRLVLDDTIAGLERRMQSSALVAGFRQPPDRAALAALPGVREVQEEAGGRLRLYHDPAQDPVEALLRLALERGWGLTELVPQRASLEDIFVSLTTSEPPAAPQSSATIV